LRATGIRQVKILKSQFATRFAEENGCGADF